MNIRAQTLEFKRICIKCKKKYTYSSPGYKKTGRCRCGGSLELKQVPVQTGKRYYN